MPIVTVWPTPSGLPTASTTSPTRTRVGVAERQRLQVRAPSIFSTARSLGCVGADDLRLEAAAVGQLDGDLLGALDDVVVGEDVAVGADDDARAEPALARGCGRAAAANRSPKNSRKRIVRDVLADAAARAARSGSVTTAGATWPRRRRRTSRVAGAERAARWRRHRAPPTAGGRIGGARVRATPSSRRARRPAAARLPPRPSGRVRCRVAGHLDMVVPMCLRRSCTSADGDRSGRRRGTRRVLPVLLTTRDGLPSGCQRGLHR